MWAAVSSLAAGAEINHRSRRHSKRSVSLMELDALPAGHGSSWRQLSRNASANRREITVVAEPVHGAAHRLVYRAVVRLGDANRNRHGLEEAWTHPYGTTLGAIHTGDLCIGTEAAGGAVNAVELLVEDLDGAP
jgi:hypothetical protein